MKRDIRLKLLSSWTRQAFKDANIRNTHDEKPQTNKKLKYLHADKTITNTVLQNITRHMIFYFYPVKALLKQNDRCILLLHFMHQVW